MSLTAFFLTCSALVTIGFGAAAQTQLASASRDQESQAIRVIVESAARNDPDWRKQADDFIRGEQTKTFGNRADASDRALRLLEAMDDRCRHGDCVTGRVAAGPATIAQSPTLDVARLAKTNACAAYPVDAVGVRRWDVPAGALAFDFQPAGRRAAAGAIPIAPGDARVVGGPRGERYIDDYVLTGDSLLDVRGFRTPVPTGRLRVILLGSTRQRLEGVRLPFGAQVEVNGHMLDIMSASPSRWLQRGVLTGPDRTESLAAANLLPGTAPAIVFETESDGGHLSLGFPQGIEVGGVIVEPVEKPSSFLLDTAPSGAVAADSSCLQEQEKIDRALAKLPSGRPTPTRTPTVETTPKPPSPEPLSPS